MPLNVEQILEYCRLCQLNPGTIHIIDNDEFIDQVFEYTKVKINSDHRHVFPKTVCSSCKLSIQEFSSFVKEVRLVDQKLHSHFSKYTEPDIKPPDGETIKENSKVNESVRFKCSVCPKTYARQRNLELHKQSHINLFCLKCESTFDDIASRKKHSCHVTKANDTCERDSNVFLQSELKEITVEAKTKDLKKEWFEDEFPENKESHTKAKDDHCLSNDDKLKLTFQDEKCILDLNTDEKLSEELNEKKKSKSTLGTSLSCTYENCKKVCTSAYTLRTHLMKHEGKMPFLCVTCGKGFTTKNSLNCHEKIHAKVKGYVCKECNIGFSVASNLRAHQKKHHEGVRFYCSQCPRVFITKCSLERHELVHTGIKEFKCETCRAEFYTNKELMKHQRYHQGLRLYKCEQCFKTFFEKHHLTIHIRVHTGERPYACKIAGCGKSFAESQKLSRHMKARHPSL